MTFQVCFLSCNYITPRLPFSLFFFTIQQQEQDPTNLYISNLPMSMDEQELENMLKHFGQVISTRILRDSSGGSRGVGFARSAIIYKCSSATYSLLTSLHLNYVTLNIDIRAARYKENMRYMLTFLDVLITTFLVINKHIKACSVLAFYRFYCT